MLTSNQSTDIEPRITNSRMLMEIPSDFSWINPTVEYLASQASEVSWQSPVNKNRVTLALHEALTNSIVHGNLEISSELKNDYSDRFTEMLAVRSSQHKYASRIVRIIVDYSESCITWSIADEGRGFDVQSVLARAESEDVSLLPSGRGLMMIKAFMDGVEYDRGGRRIKLTLQNPDAPLKGLRSTDWKELEKSFESGSNASDVDPEVISRVVQITDAIDQDEDELRDILNPLLASLSQDEVDIDDRRAHERHPFTEKIIIDSPNNTRKPAFARNISKGGLAFLCESPFESPDLTVDMVVNGNRVRIDSEIVRCTELVPNVYDIGVRFVPNTEKC